MQDPAPIPIKEPEKLSKATEPPLRQTTVLTAFGIGKSHVFYVEKDSRGEGVIDECWRKVFAEGSGVWEFGRLKEYSKPLGETVTLNLEECPDAKNAIEQLKTAFGKSFPTLNCDRVEAFLFTTGVGVLVMRVTTPEADSEKLYDELPKIREWDEISQKRIPLIQVCQKQYLEVMKQAVAHKCQPGETQWSLYHLEQVDRSEEKSVKRYSYPLFFVDAVTYRKRINDILQQVAGSHKRHVQSNEARVSYRGSEVYVDWSEALISEGETNREMIEKNFIIGFASWCALLLMNHNSSIFLLDAFAGMNSERKQESARAVHHRTMAYKDVADAILPIRWTTTRRDLFLLETIHHNWSSERVRQNIDERMKLLGLHYTQLEDERREAFNKKREEFNQKLTILGVILTLVALASAIADVTNLSVTYRGLPPGLSLTKIAFHSCWLLLVGIVVAVAVRVIKWNGKAGPSSTTETKKPSKT